ncbi:MAG: HEAT repeat domain-containing protein [Methylacidiphilales bacterium]|nr:HEAT repeat domain-containing protein [Candidatus Methylacidiphilales bacterium]
MSQIISLLFLAVLLLMVSIPVWFIGSLVFLFFSQVQRDKIRTHWFLYSVLGVISFLVVSVAWISFAPRHFYYSAIESFVSVPVTHDSVTQADAIVEGAFDTDHVVSTSGEILTFRYGPGVDANCFVVPFKVEGSAKGYPGKTINVKICFPTVRGAAMEWGLPLKKKLLLLLKKDSVQAGTFELMSQQTSWLVIVRPHAMDAPVSDPDQFVLDDAKGFLVECVDHPGTSATVGYFTDVGGFMNLGVVTAWFPQSDPAREHALQMAKELGGGDPEIAALAAKFEGEYGKVGEIASSICANSGDTGYLQSRLKDYNNQPPGTDAPTNQFQIIGNNHFNFPWQVANTIRDSDDVGKMMPLISAALASPDPRMRLFVVRALSEHQGRGNEQFQHGNQLGNQFYPIMINLLDDPDQDVRYAAMGCIFWMSGSIKQRFGHREIDLPAIMIFRKDPDLYLTQYKDWWGKHKTTLSP